MLGVPGGVKVYSSVFGVRHAAAGRVPATFATIEGCVVVDHLEAAYGDGEFETRLPAMT